jgi:hypothetical protein
MLKTLKNERPDLQLWLDESVQSPVLVASHERSGTHFLINSLAQCTAYRADPFLNLDLNSFGGLINLHSPGQIAHFLGSLQQLNCASLIKSHHPAASLEASLAIGLKVAVIIRHPAEVLLSYWRWLPSLPWHESDIWQAPAELARGIPAGACQRYQERSVSSHFERWATHAQGWLNLHNRHPDRVALITYVDLLERHASTMEQLCFELGLSITAKPSSPDRYINVVTGLDQPITAMEWQDLLDVCEQGLKHYPQLDAQLQLSTQCA